MQIQNVFLFLSYIFKILLIFFFSKCIVFYSDVPKPGKTEAIKLIVQKLPRENYQLLKTVIKFLTKVGFIYF